MYDSDLGRQVYAAESEKPALAVASVSDKGSLTAVLCQCTCITHGCNVLSGVLSELPDEAAKQENRLIVVAATLQALKSREDILLKRAYAAGECVCEHMFKVNVSQSW